MSPGNGRPDGAARAKNVYRTRMKKPSGIVYGVEDIPPTGITVLSGLQHVGLVSVILVFPLLVGREAGLSPEESLDLLSVSMLVLALGTVLQALPRGPVGARVLSPVVFTATYLTPAILAVKIGGPAAMAGMTLLGGLGEIALSRGLRALRPFFPPEICGFVVVMIGVALGSLGLRTVLGVDTPGGAGGAGIAVAVVTFAVMVALNVWTQGVTRLFCALIGMGVGYAAAAAVGILGAPELDRVLVAPIVHVPRPPRAGWAFDAALVVPFVVAALGSVVRVMGDLTITQKINDAEWVRPDLAALERGVLANGVTNVLAGLLGTVGVSTYTSSIGLAGATGVTSRRVGWAIGGIFLATAFLPKVSAVLLAMPPPVIGAALVFSACFIFVNGLQIITSRMLDARRTFVVGASFMLGLAVDLFPGVFDGLPAGVRPLFSTSLVLGTLSAIGLNALFRLGMKRRATIVVDPREPSAGATDQFLDEHGAGWGARSDVIDRARFNLAQSIETIADACEPQGPLAIEAAFDEFSLDVRVSYDGAPLELPDRRPSNEEIIASEDGQRKLAGYMLRRYADRVEASHRGGRATVLFHFDH